MLRPATIRDLAQIKDLLDAAFAPSKFESVLIDSVFNSGEEFWGWVAVEESQLTGAIIYTLAFRDGVAIGYHLAPLAVHPDFQRRGIGSELIKTTLDMPPISAASVFVLGDPAYYERFGFAAVTTAICPYNPSNEYFRALQWNEAAEPFSIGYCSAFQAAEQVTQSHSSRDR
jgi:putative acetyltransferase